MSLRSDPGAMSVNHLISTIMLDSLFASYIVSDSELQPSYKRRDFLIFLEKQIRQKPMYTVHVLENPVL